MRVQLINLVSFNFWLLVATIAAKAIAVCFIDSGVLGTVVAHASAFTVGLVIVLCVDKFTRLIHIFNYLVIGADMGSAVKNTPQPDG